MSKLLSVDELFDRRHFDREVIILCVRWYLRDKLSFRDLVEMMAERGLPIAHTTIMRWVQRYAPQFEKRWNRFAIAPGRSWRVDETYLKIRGQWLYLYRAVDRDGKTVDFRLSLKREVAAAKAFFNKAIKNQRSAPTSITLDGYAASHLAVKLRIGAMLGFKVFSNAAITIAGVDLMRRIRKGQFNLGKLRIKEASAPAVWSAVLSAQ